MVPEACGVNMPVGLCSCNRFRRHAPLPTSPHYLSPSTRPEIPNSKTPGAQAHAPAQCAPWNQLQLSAAVSVRPFPAALPPRKTLHKDFTNGLS